MEDLSFDKSCIEQKSCQAVARRQARRRDTASTQRSRPEDASEVGAGRIHSRLGARLGQILEIQTTGVQRRCENISTCCVQDAVEML